MSTDKELKIENQLCFALYASSKEFMKLYQAQLSPFGITFTQYLCLMVLWEQDGIGVKTLCEKTMLDTGTITPLLKKMEANGLLNRTREKSDERVVIVTLTSKGIELQEKLAHIPIKTFIATRLTIYESYQLKNALDNLINKLKK